MDAARKFMLRVAGKLDVPADAVAGVPRVELVGFSQCSVEPHCGLLEYGEEEILVDTVMGQVCLQGERLQIRCMNSSRLTVSGTIRAVFWRELDDRA